MPSFDVVSEIDMHEVTNAVDQANREITTRFDLKGTSAKVEQDKQALTCWGDAEFQAQQVMDILVGKLAKRGIDVASLETKDPEASGKVMRIDSRLIEGLEQDHCKKITKTIKEAKLKVQSSIQGDKVRITGKKRDDLQQAIALLKEANIGLPLQYNNFRD